MKKFSYVLAGLFVVIVALLCFWFGMRVGIQRVADGVASSQATLNFNSYINYVKIKKYFERSCEDSAIEYVDQLIDMHSMQIAEYVRSENDIRFEEYAELREPGVVALFKAYDVDWEKVYIVPRCVG